MGYQTKQGAEIAALLQQYAEAHLTVEDIVRLLQERGCQVGKTTVYRHLDKLVAAGQVRKYFADSENGACYQYAADCPADVPAHYHLKCTVCDALLHVSCDYLDKIAAHMLKQHGFFLSAERTILYGICNTCQKGSAP